MVKINSGSKESVDVIVFCNKGIVISYELVFLVTAFGIIYDIIGVIVSLTNLTNLNIMKKFESKFGIDQTVVEIENGLKKMHTSVVAIFENSDNIAHHSAVILGSSKIRGCGTKEIVDLPLKVMVWKDDNGLVWVQFQQMREKAQRYGLQDCNKVGKIDSMLMGFEA